MHLRIKGWRDFLLHRQLAKTATKRAAFRAMVRPTTPQTALRNMPPPSEAANPTPHRQIRMMQTALANGPVRAAWILFIACSQGISCALATSALRLATKVAANAKGVSQRARRGGVVPLMAARLGMAI